MAQGGGGGEGYTEISDIRSSAKQYIDTLFQLASTMSVEIRTRANGNGAQILIGCSDYRSGGFLNRYLNTGTQDQFIYRHYYINNKYARINVRDYGTCHLIVLTASSMTVDGNLAPNYNDSGNYNGGTVTLAAINTNNTPEYYCGIYESLKLYNSGVLVRDLVPRIRNSDGAVGMLDLCGSASSFDGTPFYGNLGAGTFGYKKLDGTIVEPT